MQFIAGVENGPPRIWSVQGYVMSEANVATERFWKEFKPEVAGSLSADQRNEIERVLGAAGYPGESKVGDLRLSCYWFFVRLVWGPEKRSTDRIKIEREKHPVMARRNLPMLASLFAGYFAVWYVALGMSAVIAFYFLQ